MSNFLEKLVFPIAPEIRQDQERIVTITETEKQELSHLKYDIYNLSPEIAKIIKVEYKSIYNEIRILKSHFQNNFEWFTLTPSEKRKILIELGHDEPSIRSTDSELNDYYIKNLLHNDGFIEGADKHPDTEKRRILQRNGIVNPNDWLIKTLEEKEEIIHELGFKPMSSEEEMDDGIIKVLFPYLQMEKFEEDLKD